jgi:hypothetical protein
VHGEVAELGQYEGAGPDVGVQGGRGREQGMVDMVRDECGEAPVVEAVFEQVVDRHRGVGEAMDENGFQQTFGIVDHPADGRNAERARFKKKTNSKMKGWMDEATTNPKSRQSKFTGLWYI